jgi:hypothetical protein
MTHEAVGVESMIIRNDENDVGSAGFRTDSGCRDEKREENRDE